MLTEAAITARSTSCADSRRTGEDVVEAERMQNDDLTIDALAGYDDETRALYSGGLSDDPGPDSVPMPEVE